MTTSRIALAVSLAAFALAVVNLYWSRLDRKRDLFLKMHEEMLDKELRWGREVLLNSILIPQDVLTLFQRAPEAFEAAGRAIAMMDVFALYARKGYISKDLILEEWGPSMRRLNTAYTLYIEHRTRQGGEPAWVHLAWLLDLAVKRAPAYSVERLPEP